MEASQDRCHSEVVEEENCDERPGADPVDTSSDGSFAECWPISGSDLADEVLSCTPHEEEVSIVQDEPVGIDTFVCSVPVVWEEECTCRPKCL